MSEAPSSYDADQPSTSAKKPYSPLALIVVLGVVVLAFGSYIGYEFMLEMQASAPVDVEPEFTPFGPDDIGQRR